MDGELLGQFAFWWNDEDPGEALEELRQALSAYLDEELRHRGLVAQTGLDFG